MKITNVVIRKMLNEERLKAIVSVTFDDMLVVHDIKVIEGEKGLFLAMPNKKFNESSYKDVVHPTNSEMRTMLETSVLEVFKQKLEEAEATAE